MRAAVKCLHPLLVVGMALFVVPLLVLPLQISDVLPADTAGPCSVPVFLLFVPSECMIFLGIGFSAIRVLEFRAQKRKQMGGKE